MDSPEVRRRHHQVVVGAEIRDADRRLSEPEPVDKIVGQRKFVVNVKVRPLAEGSRGYLRIQIGGNPVLLVNPAAVLLLGLCACNGQPDDTSAPDSSHASSAGGTTAGSTAGSTDSSGNTGTTTRPDASSDAPDNSTAPTPPLPRRSCRSGI